MGTMLITRSTPRITYKIGTRARLGALEDRSPPWTRWEAPSVEVAAEFTGIYRILMWGRVRRRENRVFGRYQSTAGEARPVRVWQESTEKLAKCLNLKRLAFAGARHQFLNRIAR